ncbi:M48 family metallopeptidase [Burkholderia sp. BCCIQ04A]|uniref:M48 family metallopeptidase n=4 Tax=Burkholderia TaxID=32008 RepID=A0ABU5WKR8_9BURK|nr:MULTISPECIES: M48 family metallopeptidase [Burkholderia]MEB2503587.1 M48 family metallopeptidase [Burkholderia anthinoferrum]MEB2535162.1 M48 family metallopeptidase [Burkholderia anthinoferrum]MEB2560942.1 M48 family metallopeptidase [Burkholderia anthinoferrum]MEB2579488.1 M48 family metallopeptidase [Burkholderia anthinoferrum]MDF3098835.1 M48 family metallopeptidase [Burkholderia semiarida]
MRGNRLRRLARVAAALGVGAAALAAHATDTGATAAGSAPAAAQATPPAAATSAAPAPPSAAEGAQPTGAAVPAKAYTPTPQQVRYGNAIAFRTLIPSPLLEQLTANEYAQIVQTAADSNRLLPANQPRVKRLRAIVAKLAPYSVKWNDRVKSWAWDVNAIRSRDIRLTCLPGGKVLVYGGMLERVRLNDDELGVLLAHGIAHALREHARSNFGATSQTSLRAAALPPLFGVGDPLPQALNLGERLQSLHYDPTDETEADVIGGDIAARAGFDPRAAITLWDKLAAATRANKATGFIYTHPYGAARRQDLLNRLPDLMPLYAKATGKRVESLPDYAGISAQRRKVVRR